MHRRGNESPQPLSIVSRLKKDAYIIYYLLVVVHILCLLLTSYLVTTYVHKLLQE